MLKGDARTLKTAMQGIEHRSVSYDQTECTLFIVGTEPGIQCGFAEPVDLAYKGVGCHTALGKFYLLAHGVAPSPGSPRPCGSAHEFPCALLSDANNVPTLHAAKN